MKVTLDHVEDLTQNIKTFYFIPEQPVRYEAGQFTELVVPHDNPDEYGIKHWFTLSSSPTDDFLSITTKFSEPSTTFKQALRHLEPGQPLNMADPMGDFVLPKDTSIPLVFVAGGIGITPFHSMLRWLTATNTKRNIQMIYAVRNENEIIFQDTFRDAHQHVTVVVSEPSSEWGGERGRITAKEVVGLTNPTPETLIYLSGPEPMIEALTNDVHKQGIKRSQLVTDFFPNYQNV